MKGEKYMETIKEYLLRLLAENLNMIENKGIELKEGFLNVELTIYEDRKTIEAL